VFELPLAGAGNASVHIDAPALAKLLAGRPKAVTTAPEPKPAPCA
jgi:hypothetical protein